MPTVLRSGPYRFFFYAGDRLEPPHVHVERDRNNAKFWLEPVNFESSTGFGRSELADVPIDFQAPAPTFAELA
jgi:hypothetical protein